MRTHTGSRTTFVVAFLIVSFVSIMVFRALDTFGVIPSRPLDDWRFIDRISAIVACVLLGTFAVLASVFFGINRFTLFSRLDKILTRLPVGVCGLALTVFASYTVLTKPYDYQHGLLGLLDSGAMLVGSFLCFWVFLFYARESSDRAA